MATGTGSEYRPAFTLKAFVESRLGIPFSSLTEGFGGVGRQRAASSETGLPRRSQDLGLFCSVGRKRGPAESSPGGLCALGAIYAET